MNAKINKQYIDKLNYEFIGNNKHALGDNLYLICTPNKKIFRQRFRFKKKENTITLGEYPVITLEKARKMLLENKRLILEGKNPVAEKRNKTKPIEPNCNDFKTILDKYLEVYKTRVSIRSYLNDSRLLERKLSKELLSKDIQDIKSVDIVKEIQSISNSSVSNSMRVLALIKKVYRYAVACDYCSKDVTSGINPSDFLPKQETKHYNSISLGELPNFLKECTKLSLHDFILIKMMCYTFVRTNELLGAQWSEFDFKKKIWTIPAGRMKNRKIHIVPLSDQVVNLLKNLVICSDYVFKSRNNQTIRRIIKKLKYEKRMTGHGFRSLASTILHENDFNHNHIELQLAHQPNNKVVQAYNYAQHLDSRTEMMQWYANYLDNLIL